MKILVQHLALLPATYIEVTFLLSSWLQNSKVTHTLISHMTEICQAPLPPKLYQASLQIVGSHFAEQVSLCGSPPTHISGLYIVWSSVLSKPKVLILWLQLSVIVSSYLSHLGLFFYIRIDVRSEMGRYHTTPHLETLLRIQQHTTIHTDTQLEWGVVCEFIIMVIFSDSWNI